MMGLGTKGARAPSSAGTHRPSWNSTGTAISVGIGNLRGAASATSSPTRASRHARGPARQGTATDPSRAPSGI
eukprot:14997009-Heterocapsa_arctica.AAC.1